MLSWQTWRGKCVVANVARSLLPQVFDAGRFSDSAADIALEPVRHWLLLGSTQAACRRLLKCLPHMPHSRFTPSL